MGRLATPFFALHAAFPVWRFIHMQHHRFTNHDRRVGPRRLHDGRPGLAAAAALADDRLRLPRLLPAPKLRGRRRAEQIEAIAMLALLRRGLRRPDRHRPRRRAAGPASSSRRAWRSSTWPGPSTTCPTTACTTRPVRGQAQDDAQPGRARAAARRRSCSTRTTTWSTTCTRSSRSTATSRSGGATRTPTSTAIRRSRPSAAASSRRTSTAACARSPSTRTSARRAGRRRRRRRGRPGLASRQRLRDRQPQPMHSVSPSRSRSSSAMRASMRPVHADGEARPVALGSAPGRPAAGRARRAISSSVSPTRWA